MPLPAAWSGSAAGFLALPPKFRLDDSLTPLIALLQDTIRRAPAARTAWVVLDWRLLRHRRRLDAVLVTDRAILAIQHRPTAKTFTSADRQAAEDAALDLADFHQASRDVPILPILLIPNGARPTQQSPLPLAGAAATLDATRLTLPAILAQTARFPPLDLNGEAWSAAPYAPVPGLLDAASMLYAHHGVSRLRLSNAAPEALRRTQAALAEAIGQARTQTSKTVIFLTGAPGAGKTLCGLDLAFAQGGSAAFLTGNPALVHVLRHALIRDSDLAPRAAERRIAAVIQSLPHFRDHHLASRAPPPEPILVIDEAQRCWSAGYATRKTRNRQIPLTNSEPGHLLDIMARRDGPAILVCLLGGGQEIHDGEGGLQAWGQALQSRPDWTVLAPPNTTTDPRQHLPPLPNLRLTPDLHLGAPIRAIRAPTATTWVDAVLADAPNEAARIARHGIPFRLTRSLAALRAALRPGAGRTAGLLASSTARRLRAEGLGAVLPHQDDDAVSRWFLDRWPDIRSSDALEVVATEFAVQGLELDRAGLCWDADLIRGATSWQARRFRATAWTHANTEATANRLNAYRVLLTRARHGTIIWIPEGSPHDPTRHPATYDAIAAYLQACGAPALSATAPAGW